MGRPRKIQRSKSKLNRRLSMSVLVYDGTSLASDSFANNGTVAFPFPKVWKLCGQTSLLPETGAQKLPSTLLCGVVGPLGQCQELRQWHDDPETRLDPDQFPRWPGGHGGQLVIVSQARGLLRYNNSPNPHLHGHNKVAIGEGAPFAYGALHMGATAAQAVEAAIKYSPHCNGEPEVISFD